MLYEPKIDLSATKVEPNYIQNYHVLNKKDCNKAVFPEIIYPLYENCARKLCGREGASVEMFHWRDSLKFFPNPELIRFGNLILLREVIVFRKVFFLVCMLTNTLSWELSQATDFCTLFRSSHPEVFLEKGVLKICSKCTGEDPCRSGISVKLLSNFITLLKLLFGICSPLDLLHIFRTPFLKNTSGWLFLAFETM